MHCIRTVLLPVLLGFLFPVTLYSAPATLLLEDDFNRSIQGWTAVEPSGTYIEGPLRWQWDVVSQSWVENSNRYTDDAAFSPTATAPMLINDALVTGAYTFNARLRAGDDDGFGLIFGYQNPTNFYRLTFARQNRTTGFPWMGWVVDRKVNGVSTVLYGLNQPDFVPFTLTDGIPFDVTISISADQKLTLSILDDPDSGGIPYQLVTNGNLPSAPNGKVGLMTWGMGGGAPPTGIQISNLSLTPTALVNHPPANTLPGWSEVTSGRADGTLLGGHGAGIWGLALGANGPYGTLLETSDAFAANDAQGQVDFLTSGLVAGDASWSNYLVSARVIPGDDDGHGLLLRYKDELNHYRIALRAQTSVNGVREGLSIQKVVDGVWEEIYFDSPVRFDPPSNVPYDISALIVGNRLDVLIIANPTGATPVRYSYGPFEIAGSNVPAGKIGLFSWGMTRTEFDSVRVQAVDGIPLQVTSPYGNPAPAAGLHGFEAGTAVTASVTTPFETAPGLRRVLTGFDGTGSVPASGTASTVTFNINEISSITWNWSSEVQLNLTASPGGQVTGPTGGWLPEGTLASVTAQPNAGFLFTGWSGDIISTDPNLNLTLVRPLTLRAEFAADTDADALPDSWEQTFLGNLTSNGAADPDSDGKTNLSEYQRGTNPNFAETPSVSDGLSSRWEITQRDPALSGQFVVRDFGGGFRGAWDNSNDYREADTNPFLAPELRVPMVSFEGPRMIIRPAVWQSSWNDSTASATFSVGDNDGNCLYFRYQDEQNWYRVTVTGENNPLNWRAPFGVSIQKRVAGVFTEIMQDASIATDPTDVAFYKRFRVTVTAQGPNFEVRVTGWNANVDPPVWETATELVISFVDADIPQGRFGVGTWGQGGGNTATPTNPVAAGVLVEDVVITAGGQEVFREDWEQVPLAAELPAGWTNPNTGTAAGAWQVTAHGTILQTSNYSTASTGTLTEPKANGEGAILLAPTPSTPNYFLELGFHPYDDDGIGFVYDFVDLDNYSRVLFVSETSGNGRNPQGVNVSRKSGGIWTDILVADNTFVYTNGSPFAVEFANNNGAFRLRAWHIDNPSSGRTWTWNGPAATAQNTFGFTTWGETDAHFLYARASSLPVVGGGTPEVKIDSIRLAAGSLILGVSKPEGRSYTVEQSATLEPGSWTAVAQNQTSDTWTTPLPAGQGQAFWRIRLDN